MISSVADFSAWIQDHDESNLIMMNAEEREHLYTRKEVRKALEAKEFLRKAGYPSEKEAVHLARDGNLDGMRESADDVWRYLDIYGKQVEALQGKMTQNHVKAIDLGDDGAKEQRTHQHLASDVMYAGV